MPIFLKPGSIFTCFAVLIIYTHQKLWNRSNRSAQRLHCDPVSVFLSEVFILSFFPPVCCSLINALLSFYLLFHPSITHSFILSPCFAVQLSGDVHWGSFPGDGVVVVDQISRFHAGLGFSPPSVSHSSTLTRRFRTFL